MKKFAQIMDKIIFRLFFIILPVAVLIQSFFAVSQYYDADPRTAALIPENAPEGTAYIDILAEVEKEDTSYLDFNASPDWYVKPETLQKLPVSGSSEIAQYDTENYRSLSLHTESVYQIIIYDSEKNQTTGWKHPAVITFNAPEYLELLYEKYGSFKAAYVDENGKILDMTENFSAVYDEKQENAFLADGKNLTLRISEVSPEKAVLRKKMSVIRIWILIGSLLLGGIYNMLSARKRKYPEPVPVRQQAPPEE